MMRWSSSRARALLRCACASSVHAIAFRSCSARSGEEEAMHDDDVKYGEELRDDQELSAPLRDLVVSLHEETAVPDRWRARVLEQTRRRGGARSAPRLGLLAAGVVLCAVGGGTLVRAAP